MSDTTVPLGEPFPPPPDDRDGPFLPGARVGGRYTIEERIGMGGMGVVYRARQDLTGKRVALKAIRSAGAEAAVLDRFLDEIRLLGRLDHHGLATIHDADLHARTEGGDILFFTMELVEGEPITTWARTKNLDRGARLSLISRVCEAMQYAHDHGVIHCDLKPANILVRRNGEPVVIDFGLAYLREEAAGADTGAAAGIIESPDGLGRGLAGTPSYMSPEQFQGGVHEVRAGQSVDVYALGVVAFELLAGRLPYDLPSGPNFDDLRRAVLFTPAHRLIEFVPDVDPELDRIVAKALRKDPADRYYAVAQFLRALSQFLPRAVPLVEDVWRPGVGQTIPSTNWVLDEMLGEGAVGEVWTCHHRTLKNKRIVKFCADEEKASFLRRELTLYKLLKEKVGKNPHFARLEEVALDEPPRYLMSEFIEARDFAKWRAAHGKDAPIPEAALLEIVAQAADALQAAHDAGVIHRDIKPSNLLVRGDPADPSSLHVWVGDFGIGQVVSADLLGDGTRSGFTRTLLVKTPSSHSGTHLYMAPELLSGGEASVRSDIYALGVVLYQALAGDFQRGVTIDWAGDIADPLVRADLEKCFARNPTARFPSAAQLADNLRRLPERRHESERERAEIAARERGAYRRGLVRAWTRAAGIILLVGGLAWYGFHQAGIAREAEAKAQEREVAFLSAEVSGIIGAQSLNKRATAWNRLNAGAPHVPPRLRKGVQRSALSVLALPTLPGPRASVPGFSVPAWLSPSLSYAAVADSGGSVSLQSRMHGNRWEKQRSLPPLNKPASRLVMSDTGRILGVLLADGMSVVLNFGEDWIPIPGPSSGCVAVADRLVRDADGPTPGIAAVPRPDGSIEIFHSDRPTDPQRVLAKDRIAGLPDAPPARSSSAWPRARAARDLAFDASARNLAAASAQSQLVMIWEVESGKLLALGEHSHAVSSVAWNPESPGDGNEIPTPESERVLATGAEDGVATLWNLEARKGGENSIDKLLLVPTRRLPPPTPRKVAVRQVAFASAGQQLLVLYDDGALALFDCHSGSFLDFVSIPNGAKAFSVSRYDDYLALYDVENHVTFSAPATRPVLSESKVFLGKVTDVDSDSGGQLLLARGTEGSFLVDSAQLRTLHPFRHAYGNTGRFNPGNDAFLAIGGGRFLMWERSVDPNDPRNIIYTGPAPTASGDFLELDAILLPSGDRIGVVSTARELTIKRSNSADTVKIEPFTEGTIRRQRFHPSGKWIVVIANESVRPVFIDVEARSSSELPVDPATFLDVAFSPEKGRFLALRDAAGVHVISAPEWKHLFKINLPSRLPTDAPIAFSHDGSLFLASGEDGIPQLYRIPATGTKEWEMATRLPGPHIRDVTSASFGGPGGCLLVIGTNDGYLQTWNIAELRRQLRTLKLDWEGPEWNWPENFVPCYRVIVNPPSQ